MENKKGLSSIIATLMLILLTLVLVGILWTVITNLFNKNISDTESCFDIFDKVQVNEQYTCFNATTSELQFSISMGDISVSEVLIAISGNGQKKSFKLSNDDQTFNFLRPYNGNYNANVKLPLNNSGLTYFYNLSSQGFSGKPDKIELAPVIKGTQCDVSDSTTEIIYCTSLVN